MTYAFLAALVAGGIASTILAALWQAAKKSLEQEKAEHQQTKNALAAATTGVEISEAARSDEKARLEVLVAQLKKEIDSLATNLPRDPAGVRSRLNELLGSAKGDVPARDASGAGASPHGAMPFGGATKP